MPRSSVAVPRQVVRDFGTCLNFNGTSDIVSITTAAAQNNLSTISLSAWINPRSLGESGSGRIFSKASGLTNRWRISMATSSGINHISLVAQWTGSGSWRTNLATGILLNNNQWFHVVVTYDMSSTSNDPIFYINGVLNTTLEAATPSGSLAADDTNAYIGNDSTTARTFDGKLDDVQLYKKILSQAEVTDLYYRGIAASGLVGHWKLDEGSGTSVIDATGNASTGTITGATYSSDVFMTDRTAAGSRISSGINLNKCDSFNGTSSKVTFTVPASFNPANTTQFTAAAWVKPDVLSSSVSERVIELDDGTPGKGWRLLIGNTATTFGARVIIAHTTTGAEVQSGRGVIKVGEWQRVLFTWDDADNTPKLYINGVAYNNSLVSKSGTRVNVATMTGAIGSTSAGGSYYSGLMDRINVWNRILTAQEIADDYYKGIVPSSGLILDYEMDEAAGVGTVADSSASAITGTATSVTQGVTSYTTGTRTAV